jgi:hypothetical protein
LVHWLFVISLFLPVFGGPVEITASTVDQKGCEALQRVAKIQLSESPFKYQLSDCWRGDWSSPVRSGTGGGYVMVPTTSNLYEEVAQ